MLLNVIYLKKITNLAKNKNKKRQSNSRQLYLMLSNQNNLWTNKKKRILNRVNLKRILKCLNPLQKSQDGSD